MIDQTPRDPWRAIWRIATSDHLLAALLLGLAAGLALTAWLPQMPVADPVAYSRWLSQAQARFGDATSTLQTLGLFSVTRSSGFRALLALLAGCLLLRLIESIDRLLRHREIAEPAAEWHTLANSDPSGVIDDLSRQHYRILTAPPLVQADRWPWADLFPAVAHGGAVLLLVGLLITHLWGWRVEGVIVQSGEQLTLPGTESWVALDDDGRRVTHSPGVVTFVERRGPGVRAEASDETGQPLPLQQTAEADPVNQLALALTEDQYFAVPQAQLIVRLAPQSGHTGEPDTPLLVQVYRSPPGRLATEAVAQGDTELAVGSARLRLSSAPYARLTATFNPGLWPTGAGLVLLGAGLLGSAVWPARRFWLREQAARIAGAGDLPPALTRSGEA